MSGAGSLAALFVESHDRGLPASVEPRFRLVVALAFGLVMALVDTPMALALAFGLACGAVALARLRIGVVLRRMAAVEGFLLALLLTLPFAIPGEPLLAIFGLIASVEGFARAVTLVVRINAALLVVMAMIGGLGAQRLAGALAGIGVPAAFTGLLLMTLRYIGTLGEEYRRLRTAMRVRGFRAGSNRHSWRSLGYLVGMLLVRSLERAERVHGAMLCRGYAGHYPIVPSRRPNRRDWAFLAAAGLAMAGLLAVEAFA